MTDLNISTEEQAINLYMLLKYIREQIENLKIDFTAADNKLNTLTGKSYCDFQDQKEDN